jgi:regulatory protein YycI of two-component signal transduction system YycFG
VDWSKTKTIFIMVFLILDIFLVFQFLNKREDNQFDYLTETTLEENLKGDEIELPPLSKDKHKEKILFAKSKEFTKKDTENLKDQDVSIQQKSTLVGKFTNTTMISNDLKPNELDEFLKENIYHGDNYKFWSYDKKSNLVVYYQSFKNKLFYNNTKSKLTLTVNENREIVSYEQTYLEDVKPINKYQEIIPAIKAIESLYNAGDIPPKSSISEAPLLGYYNLLPPSSESASILLTPAWRVVIDNNKDLYVTAFDGEVIELNTEKKLLE